MRLDPLVADQRGRLAVRNPSVVVDPVGIAVPALGLHDLSITRMLAVSSGQFPAGHVVYTAGKAQREEPVAWRPSTSTPTGMTGCTGWKSCSTPRRSPTRC